MSRKLSFLEPFRRRTPKSKEQAFWKWFGVHQQDLLKSETADGRICDELTLELHKIDRRLTFELGPRTDSRREFVISADGIREAFPAVEGLFAAAPDLPRWKWIKFRPRRQPMDIRYGNILVKAATIKVSAERSGQKANLVIFMPGYDEVERKAYLPIAFLMLDQALGEYDVEMLVGQIDLQPSSEALPGAHLLKDLPKVIDGMFVH